MKSPRFHFSAAVMGAFSLLLLPAAQSIGQTATATTDPVGYAQTTCLASTDSVLSIPFTRTPEFVGAISSISGNTITTAATLPVGTNAFVYGSNTSSTPGETSKTYYAIIGPNITALANPVSVTNFTPATGPSYATVTGSGFSSIVPGDEMLIGGLAYNVSAVASDTSLTINNLYTGATTTGLSASYDHSPKEGSYYTITANGANTLQVNLNGDSLSTVVTGATVSVIPYWTLISAFPASDAGTSFIASTSAKSLGSLILLPDLQRKGTNLATSGTYYYLNGWTFSGPTPQMPPNDLPLLPTTYFILRNPATAATTFTPIGGVYMNRFSTPFSAQASASQDNAVSIPRPTAMTLDQLNLVASGGFVPGTSAKNPGDLLLTYDNTAAGINKAAAKGYYNVSGVWYSTSGGINVGSSVTVPYGTGLTVRKAANSTGLTTFWQNTRNY